MKGNYLQNHFGQNYIQRYCSIDLAQQFLDDWVIKKDLDEDRLYDAFETYDKLVKEKSDGWTRTSVMTVLTKVGSVVMLLYNCYTTTVRHKIWSTQLYLIFFRENDCVLQHSACKECGSSKNKTFRQERCYADHEAKKARVSEPPHNSANEHEGETDWTFSMRSFYSV